MLPHHLIAPLAFLLTTAGATSFLVSKPDDKKMDAPIKEGGSSFTIVDNPVPLNSFAEVRYKLEAGDSVQWEVTPEPVKTLIYTDKDTGVLLFNGPAGSYTVTAFLINFKAEKFEKRRIQVTIGKPEPKPPAPKPDDPPQPKPSDDLKKRISDAFAVDKGTKGDAVQLSALYKQAAKLSGDPKKAPNSFELLRQVRDASEGLIGTDVLPTVRTVVANELATILGSPNDKPLTDAQRLLVADVFLRLSASLDALVQ